MNPKISQAFLIHLITPSFLKKLKTTKWYQDSPRCRQDFAQGHLLRIGVGIWTEGLWRWPHEEWSLASHLARSTCDKGRHIWNIFRVLFHVLKDDKLLVDKHHRLYFQNLPYFMSGFLVYHHWLGWVDADRMATGLGTCRNCRAVGDIEAAGSLPWNGLDAQVQLDESGWIWLTWNGWIQSDKTTSLSVWIQKSQHII